MNKRKKPLFYSKKRHNLHEKWIFFKYTKLTDFMNWGTMLIEIRTPNDVEQ